MEPKGSTASTAGGTSTGAQRMTETASQMAGQVAGRMGEQYEELAARGEELWQMKDEYVETARSYVREHPFQALGMAVAAGFVLSMMMRSGK